MDNPEVQSLIEAAAAFHRTSYGFLPIPKHAHVRLELRNSGPYNAMLFITAKTTRTIAFCRENGNYVWVGEQETFEGPEIYKTVDGTFHEAIVLTYETRDISGYPLNKLNVSYRGDDPDLANRKSLTLAEVMPVLKEWHY